MHFEIGSSKRFIPVALLFGSAYLLLSLGKNIWSTTLVNYADNVLGLGQDQIGLIFSVSAVPGLLAIVVGYLTQKIRFFFLLLFSFLLAGSGLIFQGTIPSFSGVLMGAFLVNVGATLFYPLINAFCLESNPHEKASPALGRMKAHGPLAAIFSGFLLIGLLPATPFDSFFVLSGAAILLLGTGVTIIIRNRFPIARDYGQMQIVPGLWCYYLLNFVNGAKSALFKSCIIVLMVQHHGFEMKATAVLVLAGHMLSFISYRIVGYLINRFGVVKILQATYVGVASIFCGFCFLHSKTMVTLLFLLDSLLFSTSVATDGFLKGRVIDKALAGHLSSGLTFFYLAAILTPLAGNLLWKTMGYEAVLLSGSIMALFAAVISNKLNSFVSSTQRGRTKTRLTTKKINSK